MQREVPELGPLAGYVMAVGHHSKCLEELQVARANLANGG